MIKIELVDNKNSIQILINGTVWKSFDKKLYFKYSRNIRSCSSEEELSDLFTRLDEKIALGYAYKLLSMRSYLENELHKKLENRHFENSVIEGVLKSCRDSGYLNDQKEGELFIEREKMRGQGPKAIRRKLGEKLGNSEATEALLCRVFSLEEERNQIQKLLNRRFPNLFEMKTKQRAFRFLQRRGFKESLICECLFGENGDF